ncbi:MAG: FtsX-like permease family protein [Gemmatimonadales bacterium]
MVTARIGQAHPDTYALGYETRLRPFVDLVLGGARQHLRLLTLAALLLLAIGTVNVGMLAASRREARTHESSVRAALGSGSVRALVPFAVETWTGIVGGAVAGTWIGWAVLRWVRSLDPAGIPRVDLMGLSGGTLLIVGLAVLLAGGVTTALAMMGVSIPNPLRTGARGTRNTPAAGRRARILVVTQVALAMTLCTGAALMVRSVRALYAVDPGVRAEGVLTARVTPRGARYRDPAARIEFHRQVREALLAAPGVRAAGASLNLPYAGRFDGDWTFQTEADQDLGIGESPVATVQMVSPGYFEAVGLRVAGRTFSERDGAMDPAVAIVNETMARRHWPGRSAIGQRIRVWNDPVKPWMEIVGVVADVRALGLDQAPTPIYYLPTTQSHVSTYFTPGEMFLSVAGDRDPELLAPVVHRAVAEVDPTAIVSSVQSLGSVIDAAVGPRSLTLWILAAFGGVALLLASIGIMASMIATVAARRSEIGIRRAFGARPVPVAARLLGQSLATVLVGAGIGGVLAIAATRAISPLLFGVEAWDPVAIGGAAVLSLASIAASLGPTSRRPVEPLESLRSES